MDRKSMKLCHDNRCPGHERNTGRKKTSSLAKTLSACSTAQPYASAGCTQQTG